MPSTSSSSPSATTVIRRSARSSLVESVAPLAPMDFMRDAKIVCSDGILRWSSLLMSQWSTIVHLHMTIHGGFTSDQPLVLLLPDVGVSTLERLLNWSLRGSVRVGRAEAGETKAALAALGVSIGFSQELINGDDVEVMEDEKVAKTTRQDEVVTLSSDEDWESDADFEIDSDEDESECQDAKQNQSSQQKKWGCPLCPVSFTKSHSLVKHLSFVHHRRQLMRIWGRDRPPGDPCPLCKKSLFAKGGAIRRGRARMLYTVCAHLGGEHGKILEVAGDAARKVLGRMRALGVDKDSGGIGGGDGEEKEWKDCLAYFRNVNRSCSTCKSEDFDDPGCLTSHLSEKHYSKELLESFGSENLQFCNICKTKVEQENDDKEGNSIEHVVKSHINMLYSLLPQEIVQLIKSCLRKKQSLVGKSAKTEVRDAKPEYDGPFKCPLCDHKCKDKSHLKRHLVRTHLTDKLLKVFNLKDLHKCNLCGEKRGTDKMSRRDLECGMAEHLARMHEGLDRVLSCEAKEKMRKMDIDVFKSKFAKPLPTNNNPGLADAGQSDDDDNE